jgi:hypothetical protein
LPHAELLTELSVIVHGEPEALHIVWRDRQLRNLAHKV